MATPSPRLVVKDSLGQRTILLDKPLVTLGRRMDTDVRLPGSDISRLHAEVVVERGAYCLRDAGSKFGTFVNDERVSEKKLAHGDRIRLGQAHESEIVFLIGDDPPSQRSNAVGAASEIRHMASLLEGLRALGSGRVLEDVLALVLDSAIDVTGAERSFIMLANLDGELEFKLARARGRVSLPGLTFATSRKIPETVFSTGRQMIVEDLLDSHVAQLHAGTVALGIRHILCTPLRLVRYVDRNEQPGEDKLIGVLYLDSRERAAIRSAPSLEALDTLATEAAVAIENARLYREAVEKAKYEQELRLAAEIQQSLLPLAQHAGPYFSVAGRSVPCRAVGGDFFDYVETPRGVLGFIVGDVAGKGAPAALLASAALGMFSAEVMHQNGAAPLVARLNAGLYRRAIESRFLTCFYGLLSPDGTFVYSNAGHNAPVLVKATGTRRLDAGGLLLGLFENVPYEEEMLKLTPGDLIVAFSDGVTEATDPKGIEYSDERLLACIEQHRRADPQALVDALVESVRAFSGGMAQVDDITVLVVRFDGHD